MATVLALLRSSRTLSSLPVFRQSLQFASRPLSRPLPQLSSLRQASALATATRPVQEDLPSNNDQPEFAELDGVLSPKLLAAVTEDMKLTHMSPVQAVVLPQLAQLARPYDPNEPKDAPPRDLLVKARTGTGKTLAFLLPAIQGRLDAIEAYAQQAAKDTGNENNEDFIERARLSYARENVGIVIISPTRELANQIAAEALRVTQRIRGFGVRTLVGGESKGAQMRGWTKGRLDVVVATPGRLQDLLQSEPEVKRGVSKAKMLVLDEADTLLDMGFRDDIDAIKEYMPPAPERQTFLFSATVSPAIRQIAQSSLSSNHAFINCVSEDSSPVHAHVQQYHTVLPTASEQIPHILRLIAHDQLSNPGASKIIIFLPTTKMTQLFATILRETAENTLPAGRRTRVFELHSKRRMESRTHTSDAFRSDKSGASVLITSDVSARGVDYPNVSRVIQVGVPSSTEQYIHRVGRTGRANTEGRGDLVLLPWELGFLNTSLTSVPLKPLTVAELKSQVSELAAEFDANPRDFFKDAPTPPPPTPSSRYNDRRIQLPPKPAHFLFIKKTQPVVEDINRTTEEFLCNMDEESVRETFMSNLGFYVGLASELRLQKMEIVDGCKTWAKEGLGLAEEPYVPPALLQRLGIGAERSARSRGGQQRGKSFGLKSSGDTPRRSSWAEHGQQRLRRDDGEFGGERQGRRQFGGERSGGGRSFRDRDGGENGGDRPFRRTFRDRDGGEDGGDRPFRRTFRDRDGGEEGGYARRRPFEGRSRPDRPF